MGWTLADSTESDIYDIDDAYICLTVQLLNGKYEQKVVQYCRWPCVRTWLSVCRCGAEREHLLLSMDSDVVLKEEEKNYYYTRQW
jgi:hypothetical protein